MRRANTHYQQIPLAALYKRLSCNSALGSSTSAKITRTPEPLVTVETPEHKTAPYSIRVSGAIEGN